MIVTARNLETTLKFLNDVLPPIKLSICRDTKELSVTTEVLEGEVITTTGNNSEESHILFNLLYSNGALIAFIHNVASQRESYYGRLNIEDAINSSSTWSNTPQGQEFWYKLHTELGRLLRERLREITL